MVRKLKAKGFENHAKRVLKNLTFTEQNRSDKGIGTADQAASLSGAVAVIVTRVLGNGNLFVEGKKVLALVRKRRGSLLVGL